VSKLNPQQQAAIQELNRPLLVLAGAGSGKTRVITEKIAYLVDQGVSARNIAAITFTNKAAREMHTRVTRLLDSRRLRGLRVSTFHSLGLDILKSEQQSKSSVSIFDEHDRLTLIQDLLNQCENSEESELLSSVSDFIRTWKNQCITVEEAVMQSANPVQSIAAHLYEEYNRKLTAYNAVDFDDLIFQPVLMFKQKGDILERWQNRIRYLLVDEYQDTNLTQYQLVKLVSGKLGQFTVVGDDDQSVYSWRGARPENLSNLKMDYPRLRVIKLEQNYRSTGRILSAANTLIQNNPHVFEKRLWSAHAPGACLRVMNHRSEEYEAQQIASEIVHHKFKFDSKFHDYAVLYRGNHQSRLIEKALRENNVPYHLSGGDSFFNLVEVKDILAYLRLLCNQDDDPAFLRIVNTPRRAIGSATLETLSNYATKRGLSLFSASCELGLQTLLSTRACARLDVFSKTIMNTSKRLEMGDTFEVVSQFLDEIDYENWLKDSNKSLKTAQRKINNVNDLIRWLQTVGGEQGSELTLAERIAKMAILDVLDRNQQENEGDWVQLMTLHSAKGLEFPHVHIMGFEENLLPHRSSIDDDNIEEERRLAYVGITRAQRTVTLHYCTHRKRYGELLATTPSRFLNEFSADDIDWKAREEVDQEARRDTARENLSQLKSLLS